MNKCQAVQKLLADYRTGILTSRKSAWVGEHIGQCAECANELRVLDDVLAMVNTNTPQCEPPAGLWNAVYNRITAPEPRRQPLFRHWAHAAGIGAAVVILAVGTMFSFTTHNHTNNAPVRMASNAEYVQGHALYTGQTPLADRVGYLSVVAASSEQSGARTK